jgi:hypothetical protein
MTMEIFRDSATRQSLMHCIRKKTSNEWKQILDSFQAFDLFGVGGNALKGVC